MKDRFETFTVQIAKISRNIRRIKTQEMQEFDLKSPHVSCIYYLYRHKATMTAKELCEVCDEDKASMSRSIDQLERLGLISCSSKTNKRYNSPLSLTTKGIEIGEIISSKINNIVSIASAGISDSEREIFYKCLLTISNNLSLFCSNTIEEDN